MRVPVTTTSSTTGACAVCAVAWAWAWPDTADMMSAVELTVVSAPRLKDGRVTLVSVSELRRVIAFPRNTVWRLGLAALSAFDGCMKLRLSQKSILCGATCRKAYV